MIIEIEGEDFNYLYLKTLHAEEQQLLRDIGDEVIKEALHNRQNVIINRRGRWEFKSAVVLVIVEDDQQGYFDGIILTVYKV